MPHYQENAVRKENGITRRNITDKVNTRQAISRTHLRLCHNFLIVTLFCLMMIWFLKITLYLRMYHRERNQELG